MEYKTYDSSATLNDFVKCFWTLEGPEEPQLQKQRIIPDGCMEMIFHYGDLYRQYTPDGSSVVQPRCFVFGQITAPLYIAPTGASGIFAARFSPEGCTPFITIPAAAMENKAIPLEELFGQEGVQLEQEVLQATDTVGRIKIVEDFLRHRLTTPEAIDRIVQSSLSIMLALNGQLSVGELSRQVNINRRQLERRFSTVIGLSPKQLAKIIRLKATLNLMLNRQFTSLTALAQEGAYYDQAHFIKDFKEFTGMSPRKFYADDLRLSAFFHSTD
jgi:AraC-like DNA-binding protein